MARKQIQNRQALTNCGSSDLLKPDAYPISGGVKKVNT